MWLLYDSMHPQVWAGFFFSSEHSVVFYKAASTEKSYYVSRIQVWTPSDGQSLWSWGVSKASPTFSKKSVIHTEVNVFGFSFRVVVWFTNRVYCVQVL